VDELDDVATHFPSALLAIKVKLKSAPSQAKVAGNAGMSAMLLVGEQPADTVNPATQASYADWIADVSVQEARSTAVGALVTSAGAAPTLKVDELDDVATHFPSALLAIKVKLKSAPSQAKVAGNTGMSAMLLVGEQPADTVNPATQASYAVWIADVSVQEARSTADGAAVTSAGAAVIVKVALQVAAPHEGVKFEVAVKITVFVPPHLSGPAVPPLLVRIPLVVLAVANQAT
jgi:hypothetical protein